MNFVAPQLVAKYGSWVRVQVAFYDFLFWAGINMCPKHFRETAIKEATSGGWKDGGRVYERAITGIEETFKTPEEAWASFIERELGESRTGDA